jgi:hypothetical protein
VARLVRAQQVLGARQPQLHRHVCRAAPRRHARV